MDVYVTKAMVRTLFTPVNEGLSRDSPPTNNFVARAFSSSHPEKPGSSVSSLKMLLQALVAFTIVFVFFTN